MFLKLSLIGFLYMSVYGLLAAMGLIFGDQNHGKVLTFLVK